jgi:hypothetical protein
MKYALAVLALFIFSGHAKADSTTVIDVSATTCYQCFGDDLDVNLNAQLTLNAVTGSFFNSGGGFTFDGTEYEVTSMTGTLNGGTMTLGQAPFGIGSWLYLDPSNEFELGSVYFTANGSSSWLENDYANALLESQDANGGTSTPITWDPQIVSAPEPNTLLMAIVGIGIVALLWRKRVTEI